MTKKITIELQWDYIESLIKDAILDNHPDIKGFDDFIIDASREDEYKGGKTHLRSITVECHD